MKQATLVAVEGPDGAGKTTVVAELKKRLEENGDKVLAIREPGGSILAEQIRTILKTYRDPKEIMFADTELLLFLAARCQMWSAILTRSLLNHRWIIMDRYELSTLVYQGIINNLAWKNVVGLRSQTDVLRDFIHRCRDISGTPAADLVLYLDVTPETAKARATREGQYDRFDGKSLDEYGHLCSAYRKAIVAIPHVTTINANCDLNNVVDQCMMAVLRTDPAIQTRMDKVFEAQR